MKNINKQFIIKSSELPLFCNGSLLAPSPLLDAMISHPKVYLNMHKNKLTKCPYCGIQYILIE